MTNYIDPFKKRTFSERFKAVFAFIKQNFVQVMKYDLLIFAAIAALVSWYETANPDSSINNLGSLINFVAFAYFAYYVTNQGDVRAVSFKDMLKSMGSAFGRVFVASLLPLGLAVLFVLVFLIYFFVMILIVGGGFDNVSIAFIVIVLIPLLVFLLYVTPIFSIYYIHYYFSCKSKGYWDALEDSFRMVKGHWWSTMGFIVLFEILQLIVLLPVILFLQEKTTFISGWIGNLLIFVVSFFTIHVVALYQYGHLKALKEENVEAEQKKIITVKMVITTVVILLVCIVGACNAEKINSILPNLASMFGNSSAQNEIGRKYLNGDGVEQDYEEAVKWFLKAANKGNAAAQYNLGNCYREGLGVEQDSLESFKWINKAAAQGLPIALNNLGVCYMSGYGVEVDKGKARELYIQAAEKGEPMAMHNLAQIYMSGNGVEKDEKEAVKWWRKAAEKDFTTAKYRLGRCYEDGIGVEKNMEEAFNWFVGAAKEGNASAQYKLGLCYLDGEGVAQDSLECFNWINKAAAQGHVDALNQLAYCYAEGVGTDVDLSMAHATIDKAIQIDPDEANLYDSKGEFYMMVGDREKAQEMYEKVIEKNPAFYKEFTWSRLYQYINNVPE